MDNLLNSSEIGTLFLDGQLRIRKFTNSLGRELNLLPHDIGRPISDLGHPLLKEASVDVTSALAGESHDRSVRSPAGKWFLLRIMPYQTRATEPQGVVITMVNITPLKNAEETLRAAQASVESRVQSRTAEIERARLAAEAATLAKNEFLTNTTSEIRAPLDSALGCIELAMEAPLSEQQRSLLAVARQRGLDLLAMLNNVVDLSRIEADRLGLVIEEFDLRTTVEDALRTIEPQIQKKAIALHLNVESTLPSSLRGDAPRLRQVLFNVLANAAKFTEKGRIDLHVEFQPDSEKRLVHFAVRDTGIGIAPEFHSVIFDPFRQVESGPSRRYPGAGLGLAVSRRLVEKMGGRIWVESSPGLGSLFHFTVPLGAVGNAPTPDGNTSSPEKLGHLRILLVDDDENSRMIVSAHLRALGHVPAEADSAEAALPLLRQQAYDAVIMDIEMPGTSGYDLIRSLRADVETHDAENRPICTIPVIALSSHTMAADRLASRTAGMDAFLEKPIVRSLLAKALSQVAHKRHE